MEQEQQQANLRKAEEMLTTYIQQRKKPLAQLALSTLLELAPNHPRRQEYELWVRDLDAELVMQQRIDEKLQLGRAALRQGDLVSATQHLEALRKVDPMARATERLADEISAARQGEAESADIRRHKETIEGLISQRAFEQAEQDLLQLSKLDVPKVTIDFLRKRLAEAQARARDDSDAQDIIHTLERQLQAHDWQGARETAHNYGERFPTSTRASELFNRVAEEEATERRKLSIQQGVQTLQGFVAEGRKHEAALALKLLQHLKIDAELLARLEQQVEAL